MRAVVQRVERASVEVVDEVVGKIGQGLLVLVAVHSEDTDEDLEFIRRKILNLRIFDDLENKMNRSVKDVGGEILVVSQFTLYGRCRKGNRPSYSDAASPQRAEELYERLLSLFREDGVGVQAGRFQARMAVSLLNDGPVTLILDSRDPA